MVEEDMEGFGRVQSGRTCQQRNLNVVDQETSVIFER